MPIEIKWVDPNGPRPMSIYRSATPIPDSPLPPPLAVVEDGNSYIDDTVERNKPYYYRLSRPDLIEGNLVLSPNKLMAYMPYTGPGPQQIKRGDWNFGWFGRMPLGDLFTPQELLTWSGIASFTESDNSSNEWVKLIYKGKVYFTTLYPIAHSLTWLSMYQAGIVYGDIPSAEWPPYPKATYGILPQGRTLTKGEHLFSVRLPSSRKNPQSTNVAVSELTGGEYDQFIAALSLVSLRAYADPNGNPQLDDYGIPPVASFTTDVSAGVCLNRGYTPNSDAYFNNLPVNAPNGANGWRPLLVLQL